MDVCLCKHHKHTQPQRERQLYEINTVCVCVLFKENMSAVFLLTLFLSAG